jgi:hypothetical protein
VRRQRSTLGHLSLFIAHCSLVILLAWALRLHRLDAQSFWYDEGYCAYVAALPAVEIILWTAREFTPPFYHSLLALWLPQAGWTEFAARFLSVWAGVLVVAGMVRLGRELHSRTSGLLAGLLAALSPFYVWHSRDTRMYMPQALFGLLGTILLLRALRAPRRWRLWVGLALLDALSLYTHTTGGFLLLFHALVILASSLNRAGRVRLIRGGLALAVASALWLPWLIYALPFLGENAGYWAGRLNWQFVVSGAFRGFVTGQMMDGTAEVLSLAAWSIACLVGVLALLVSPDNQMRKAALFLLAYFTVQVAAMAWLFQDVPKFSPRYLILASPPVLLLPALGIAMLLRCVGVCRALGGLALAALTTTAGLGLHNLYFNSAFANADFRTAAHLVREQIASDEIVLIVPGPIFPVWQFYFGPEGWHALPDDPILDVDHVLHYENTVGQLNEWLADRSGVWLVQWEPWVVDPTDLVVHLLEQVGKEMPLPEEPLGLRLRHYRLQVDQVPLPFEPAVSPPADSSLDLPLSLVGCTLTQRIRGNEEVRAGCYWEAHDALPHHLSISARLLDTAGAEWGRADSAISGPYLVAGRWPLDDLVLGRYALWPFPGIPPGDFYWLQLLVYEPDGAGHGTVTAGAVVIERPSSPFTEAIPSEAPVGYLDGLTLETANVQPKQTLPGAQVWLEAIWQVGGPFHEPHLVLEGSSGETSLLPRAGATAAWEIGDRYRTLTRVPVSPYALGGETSLLVVLEDGEVAVGSVHVDVTRTFALPAGIQPLNYRLGDTLSLAGTQFSVERDGACETAEVVLYWRAEGYVDQSYTVFAHLIGPDGQIHAQADGLPQAGRHPTTHWLPGEVVADPRRLEQPAGTPPGEYRVLVGLYDLTTLERLPVTDAHGTPVPDNAIPIGSWEVP